MIPNVSTEVRLSATEVKDKIGDILNRAEFKGEPTILQRRGKAAAAVISMEDYMLLRRLIEQEEDRLDREEADRVLADESDEVIPWGEAKAVLSELPSKHEAERPKGARRVAH